MNLLDIAELIGYMVSAWALGFCGGYTFTKFNEALSHVS